MPEHRSPAAPRWPHRLRRALTGALWLVALWWFGGWLWDQPFMERPRMLWRINRMDAPLALPVPVQGVAARRIADTWHGPRDGGARRHEGTDIFAARGTPVRSSTVGIVASIREGGIGGKQVWVLDRTNPVGRPVEGLTLLPGWESFVGAGPMPMPNHTTRMGTKAALGSALKAVISGYMAA